jgi:bifunctional non-homologous end joining protein LigD
VIWSTWQKPLTKQAPALYFSACSTQDASDRLSRRLEPFDSDQFIFELKVDGFRALAHIDAGEGQLTSRNGNVFHGFAELATWIAEHLRVESAVLDGEIACVDEGGRPVFRDLLFRRRQCVFIVWPAVPQWKRFADAAARREKNNVEGTAAKEAFTDSLSRSRGKWRPIVFEQIVSMDLEGIVCKRKDPPYKVTEKPSRYWIKVKNSRYSQLEGRAELFEELRT